MEKEKLTKEVLTLLLDTAMYGSPWLGLQFDKTQVSPVEGEDLTDTAARILLAGGKVEFIDNWAEEPYEIYSDTGYFETDAGIYPATLEDIRIGLENAECGKWTAYDEEMRSLVKEDFAELMLGPEDSNLDMDMADRLMQVILFNETVY